MDNFNNEEYFANLKRCEAMGEEIALELAKKAKPCPLCGNGNLEIIVRVSGCPPWTTIRCMPCNLFCGGMESGEVIEKWNTRKANK